MGAVYCVSIFFGVLNSRFVLAADVFSLRGCFNSDVDVWSNFSIEINRLDTEYRYVKNNISFFK